MRLFKKYNPQVTSGVDRCVVYFQDETQVWPGVVTVEDEYEILENTVVYVDGLKRRTSVQGSDYSAKISSYTFPDKVLDDPFGMCFRVFTKEDHSEYELHLVYNCYATLESIQQQTLTNEVNIPGFSIDISTKPVNTITFENPLSHLIIRTKGLWTHAVEHIEDILYGTSTEQPRLPSIDEIIDILELYVWLKITDNGDGTWDAEEMNGAVDIIDMVSETEFAIDWVSANYIQEQTYNIHSL